MSKPDLTHIVGRIVDLPTLPQVVTAVMSLIEDPNSSASDINAVMSHDPALAGKILKVVNSSFYGLPHRVTSIQQAITILGFNTVRSVAISASVFDLFTEGDRGFSYEGFWTFSIGTALSGRRLSDGVREVDGETMFVVGLLHGTGRLILDQYAPLEFQEILSIARAKQLPFQDAESEVIGTTAAELGYWLVRRWKLAEDVQDAIRFQNDVAACPEEHRSVAALLALGRFLCRILRFGEMGDFDQPTPPRAAMQHLGMDVDLVMRAAEEVKGELERAEDLLNVVRA